VKPTLKSLPNSRNKELITIKHLIAMTHIISHGYFYRGQYDLQLITAFQQISKRKDEFR
jgi:hypothetical protein